MLPDERPLLLPVAFEAQLIEGLAFQAPVIFAMGVVTVGTADLAFPDRMMGRQGGLRKYLGMAFEAGIRFSNSHRSATGLVERRVRNGADLRDLRVGCASWQSAQATPWRSWYDECQAMWVNRCDNRGRDPFASET